MSTLETKDLPVASTRVSVELVNHETTSIDDFVSVEEPLEIRRKKKEKTQIERPPKREESPRGSKARGEAET